MTIEKLYNNLGFESISIMLILERVKVLSLTRVLLILPMVSHMELLNYLSRRNSDVRGIEKLIIDKTSYFSNFNKRFYDNLCGTLNAIQFLHELNTIEIREGNIISVSEMPLGNQLGKRTEKIKSAAPNIVKILADPVEQIYLNLRIEL